MLPRKLPHYDIESIIDCLVPVMQINKYFLLLLTLISQLSLSTVIVNRKDEGDWFADTTGNIQCRELNAYEKNGGCQCYYSLTFSSENMACRSYQKRGE